MAKASGVMVLLQGRLILMGDCRRVIKVFISEPRRVDPEMLGKGPVRNL